MAGANPKTERYLPDQVPAREPKLPGGDKKALLADGLARYAARGQQVPFAARWRALNRAAKLVAMIEP